MFVALVAPAIFPAYLELHIGMFASVLLALVVFLRDRDWILHRMRPQWKWGAIAVGVGGLAAGLSLQAGETIGGAIALARNFYGVLRVTEEETENPLQQYRALMHGRIVHGLQFTAAEKQSLPTAYYGRESGVGRILSRRQQQRGLRVGVVGLGVGTVATYGRPGDYFRFYEINPEVIKFAVQYFTFLDKCRADYEIVLGDARLSLEHEQPQHFDVLVLDAFSGDAIPAHLLTREAGDVYLRHLKPGGVLAVHISNLHFDLRPVVRGLAEHHRLASVSVFSSRNPELGTKNCLWMLMSSDRAALDVGKLETVPLAPNNSRLLWTDDRSNLFEILR